MTGILSATSVTDPLGRNIIFPDILFLEGETSPVTDGLYQLLINAVEAPSCMIELPNGSRYYFGLTGQNFTSLLEIVLKGERWSVQRCIKNPLPKEIQKLLQKGKFIAGRTLD